MELCDKIHSIAIGINNTWLIGGDFDMVLNEEKKIGGLSMVDIDHEDFKTCIKSYDLEQVYFKRYSFHLVEWKSKR